MTGGVRQADRPAGAAPAAPASEIAGLLALLDDPDPVVQQALVARLRRDDALLDQAWTAAAARSVAPPDALLRLVLAADAQAMVDRFAAAEDLEAGCWLLPLLARPRCDHRRAGAVILDQFAARLPDGADGVAIAAWLGADCGFTGDRHDYHDPANSFLPDVLARRTGLPIALTALWLLLCRRRGVAAEAVALPGHVLGHCPDGPAAYLDLFAGGRVIERPVIARLLRDQCAGGALAWPGAASDRALLRRMARNLVVSYTRLGDRLRATIAHGMASA